MCSNGHATKDRLRMSKCGGSGGARNEREGMKQSQGRSCNPVSISGAKKRRDGGEEEKEKGRGSQLHGRLMSARLGVAGGVDAQREVMPLFQGVCVACQATPGSRSGQARQAFQTIRTLAREWTAARSPPQRASAACDRHRAVGHAATIHSV